MAYRHFTIESNDIGKKSIVIMGNLFRTHSLVWIGSWEMVGPAPAAQTGAGRQMTCKQSADHPVLMVIWMACSAIADQNINI